MRIELIVCEKKNHVYKIKDLQVFGKMRETHIRIVNREHLVKLNFDIGFTNKGILHFSHNLKN